MTFERGQHVAVTFGDGVEVACVVVRIEQKRRSVVVVVRSLDLGDEYRVVAHPLGIRLVTDGARA